MATDTPRSKRRWSRVRLAVVVLVAIASVIALDAYRRQRRVQWLVAEIEAVGGDVAMPEPLLEQLRHSGWSNVDDEVFVALGRLPAGWLRQHDYLEGLGIQSVWIHEGTESLAEFITFLERHPIEEVHAPGATGVDQIALALEKRATVRVVDFSDSDLTDGGFRSLPLEQLTELFIDGTRVTSAGADDFRRCGQMTRLWLDGKQAESAISGLIATNQTLDTLSLRGPGIENRHLERLHALKLNCLFLRETSVSDDAISALESRLPRCFVSSGISFEE